MNGVRVEDEASPAFSGPGVRDVAVASGKAIDQVLADKGDLTYFAVGVDLTKRADGVLFL